MSKRLLRLLLSIIILSSVGCGGSDQACVNLDVGGCKYVICSDTSADVKRVDIDCSTADAGVFTDNK